MHTGCSKANSAFHEASQLLGLWSFSEELSQVAFVAFKSGDLISDLLEQFAKSLQKTVVDSHNTAKYAWKLPAALHQFQLSKKT